MRASKVMRSLREACVIQVLAPVIDHPSCVRTPRVVMLPRSDPVSGSVKTAVGSTRPLAISGSHSDF